MEGDALFAGDPRTFLNRLNGADLIVGVHDADEDRARCQGLLQIIRIDAPESIDRKVSYSRAQALKKPTRFDHGWMFDPGGDEVIAVVPEGKVCALKREIVGLTAAAGEENLVVLAPEQGRNLAACCLQRSLGVAGGPMHAIDGLPKWSARNGSIAAATAGSMGVLAL